MANKTHSQKQKTENKKPKKKKIENGKRNALRERANSEKLLQVEREFSLRARRQSGVAQVQQQ